MSSVVAVKVRILPQPAFVGLFYLSANHIKFTYSIKGIIMEYKVITGLFISGKVQEEFTNDVNTALSEGWELQ
ncbi:MAG: hypothetical protein QF380_05720, partial [Candidatus Marinimicrobia bacterium]|nr:hypothetical protein [Candidatus Neomarinimicrobiota bacterium]